MIYVLEDDASIRELEMYALKSAGMQSAGFANGADFLAASRKKPPELAIIDLMLPGDIDGIEAMKRLHGFSPGTRVMIASAKGGEFDRVQGLDLGADDYLVKPFGMLEMVSRVKAVLRRGNAGSCNVLRSGGILLDPAAHSVRVDGADVELTRKEFALLGHLLSNPSRVFTRENLLERIWSAENGMETRTVDMHVAALRSKLGRADVIETVRGVGYRLGKTGG